MFTMHLVLEILKKDLFVIMKGYMCNYDFYARSFIKLFMFIAFMEGVCAKLQCIYCMESNFCLKVYI